MHVSLVAATLIAVSAMVVHAAVPLHVSTGTTIARQPAAPGTLAGEVRDAQGNAIAGAVVDAVHAASGWRALALTDRQGRFSLAGVPAGQIALTVRRDALQFVETASVGELTRLIEKERESGVFLSVLGVGRGNLKDATLEALADRGNGHYAHVDSLQEARRVVVVDVDTAFATAVAEAALVLRKDPLVTKASLASAVGRAAAALGTDPGGWRAEFVRLMHLASSLQAFQAAPPTSEPD